MAVFVIVGGGVAGLSAGIFAAKEGHRAIVIERQDIAGGNLTGWHRGEYTIDNCVHWLIGTREGTKEERLWREVGVLGGEGVRRLPLLYTVEEGGESVSLFRDFEKTERQMLALSPEDGEETLRFCRAVRALMRFCVGASESLPLSSALRALPTLSRYYCLSAGELADRFSHPLLRRFMTGLVGRDFASLAFLFTAANFCAGNADLPVGGSLAAAERMTERFLSLGGILRTGQEVVRVLTEGKEAYGVRLADGEEVAADAVILAADPAALFGKILDAPMPRAMAACYRDPAMRRFSSVGCAFAAPADLPFSGDLVLRIGRSGKPYEVGDGRLVLRGFSHEPTFAPEGETVITTMRFFYEDGCRHFLELSEDREAYRKEKARLLADTEGDIVDRFPSLSGKLRPLDIWTPATYRRFTGAPLGTYMGFLLPPGRLPRALSPRLYGWKNIFLATQWQSPPGGLPTALSLGERAARMASRSVRETGDARRFRKKASIM